MEFRGRAKMPASTRICRLTLVASLGRLMSLLRPILACLAVTALGLLWLPGLSLGDLHHDLSSRAHTAAELRAAIAGETRRIEATGAGVREAQGRLTALQGELSAREAQLAAVQRSVIAARNRLTRLENRQHLSARLLSANLVAGYKDQPPDVVSVVLESHGFDDMLERLHFMERIERHNAQILGDTKAARVRVLAETTHLQRLQTRHQDLVADVLRARNAAAVVQGALLTRQAEQLQQRASTAARLSRVRGQISSLRSKIARLSRPVVTGLDHGLPIDAGGMAQAPANAPAAVKQVIAAGNAIAGLPYLYGGGHQSFRANAYDCSGSVSYALAAAGLLSSPLDSTAFESWGEAGAGRWITVYANAGHAFMVVAGWRFDTSSLSQDSTRWTRSMRSTSGFVARHPPGL
jgi:cell wall-associated NlpC family hydrolase